MTGNNQEIRLEAFRQHWEQMRHTENLRYGFTSFYVLIVVGILAFVSQTPESEHCTIYIAGAALSLLGLLFCCRVKHSIEIHREKALFLAKSLGVEDEKVEKYLPFTPESGCMGYFSMRNIFLTLYGLGLLVFIILPIIE